MSETPEQLAMRAAVQATCGRFEIATPVSWPNPRAYAKIPMDRQRLTNEILRLDQELADYKECVASKEKLTKELDDILSFGEGAKQASLCDVVALAEVRMKELKAQTVPKEISEREKFLMRQAIEASAYYKHVDKWLSETIIDQGHTVEMHLNFDANNL